jgi:hypothetical protein
MPSQRMNEYNKMSRNESKSSSNFTKEQIRSQQQRIQRMNENYNVMDSPDIGPRKANNKVGV